MRRNTDLGWGPVARGFHWLIAVAILTEVPAGLIMSRTFGAKDAVGKTWQYWTSNFHHTAGLVILAVAFLRIGWRLANPVPGPASMRPVAEKVAAKATHGLLYVLLILIPLSGWAALSSLADSIAFGHIQLWFFGTDGFGAQGLIPHIVTPRVYNDPTTWLNYMTLARSHRWLLIVGGILLTLHVAAALRHHFILRDRTLQRMLKGNAP
jgi:cytochrome b561